MAADTDFSTSGNGKLTVTLLPGLAPPYNAPMDSGATSTDFDIAIVGGGMVGAALACALGDCGLRIGLFDSGGFDPQQIPWRNKPPAFDPRVSAIAPSSRRLLTRIGAWSFMTELRLSPYTDMHVWDADGTGSIHFSAADIHAECLGHIIENSVILAGLYQRLERMPAVSLVNEVAIDGFTRLDEGREESAVRLTAGNGGSWTATLLIGADGPNSKIRQLAGFRTREWDYEHQAIVTTVRTELPHRATALQRFMASGPLAFLPLQAQLAEAGRQQHTCSIVWSLVPERAAELLAMEDVQFASELGIAIEHRLGAIEWTDRRFSFPLRQRHAVDYVQPNIALLGDAAHTIHPLAGQGVNLGFLDVEVLAKELTTALERRRPLADFSILRRYQRARKGHNLGMMGMMEGFKLLFAQDALPIRWLRNAGMSGVDQLGFLKNRLMREAMGIQRTEDRR